MPLTPMPPDELRSLQALFRRLGYDLGTGGPLNDGVDGDWGGKTAAAFASWIRNYPATIPAPKPAPQVAAGWNIPATVPAKYAWLTQIGMALPRTIWLGLELYGTLETPGAGTNPELIAWAKEVGLSGTYSNDAVPWCGLYAAVVCARAGKEVPKDPLWALNWAKFGEDAGHPGLGDVLVFQREGGGHVGFYVGEDSSAYHVLGGNQSDKVSIARVEKKRLYAARRPLYRQTPASVRPYLITSSGEISTNEA